MWLDGLCTQARRLHREPEWQMVVDVFDPDITISGRSLFCSLEHASCASLYYS